MHKISFLTILFLGATYSLGSYADAPTRNWCGIYTQEGNYGYIRIAREDLQNGSIGCTSALYEERSHNSGTVELPFEVNKKRTAAHEWQNFNNHLIEIRGKNRNGVIEKVHFVRDINL